MKSRGSWIWNDERNEEFLDFHGGFGSNPLGHNHPELVDIMSKVPIEYIANKPANGDFYTHALESFVTTFQKAMIPHQYDTAPLFFIDGGAAANDNAIKVAQDYRVQRANGREDCTQIMHLHNAFHGRSGYTLSVTNTDPHKVKRFARFTDWPRVDVEQSDEGILSEVNQRFKEAQGRVAGLLVEPIQGEGGDHHLSEHLLLGLQTLCRKWDSLLIMDEVQTGFFTTGRRWCFEHFHGLEPDVVSFGKKSQQCGIFTHPRISENLIREGSEDGGCIVTSGRISSTWSGNLVDMIRSTHIMEIILRNALQENAVQRGIEWLNGMRMVAEYKPSITNIRGKGLFMAFDVESTEQRDRVIEELYEKKRMLALGSGHRTVRFRPNLAVSPGEVQGCIDRIATLESL